MRKLQSKLIGLLALSVLSLPIYAAVNPTSAGAESQGSFDVSLVLNPEVQITGLRDLGVLWDTDADASSNPTKAMKRSMDFCVYSSAGPYAITMSSNNGQNTYLHTEVGNYKLLKTGQALSEDALYSYYMNFTPLSGGGNAIDKVVSGQKYKGYEGATNKNYCAGGKNARLDVYIRANDNVGLQQGVYSDVLNITVSPE